MLGGVGEACAPAHARRDGLLWWVPGPGSRVPGPGRLAGPRCEEIVCIVEAKGLPVCIPRSGLEFGFRNGSGSQTNRELSNPYWLLHPVPFLHSHPSFEAQI